jgi:2-methylisocitrate lyase-like PEP mutase family enzyme
MPDSLDHAGTQRRKFRELLARPKLTVMPGGFSPLYARMAEEIGFDAFFIAGSQTAAFLYGVPDNGIIGLREIADHVRQVAARAGIPILVDCDTGYGNAVNVTYAVEEIIRTGAAALQIEDQEAPKKSGTVAGRRCIPLAEAVGKIRAATAARDAMDASFVICARCDVLGAEGGTFEDAVKRSVAYATEGRADLIWLNSVQSIDDVRRACAEIPAPVLVVWGGPLPAPTPAEYEAAGAKIALYPAIAATSGMNAAWRVLNDLHERGPQAIYDYSAEIRASKWGPADQNALVKLERVRAIEDEFLPAGVKRDYDKTWGHVSILAPDAGHPSH